jgi:hypothetical protein
VPNEWVVGPWRVYLKACNPSGETDQVRFTEQFQVQRSDTADWFDLNVEMDTPLYVDPFLIFDDKAGAWEGAHDQIVDFFQGALLCLGSRMHRRILRIGRRSSGSCSSLNQKSSPSGCPWATQKVQASVPTSHGIYAMD